MKDELGFAPVSSFRLQTSSFPTSAQQELNPHICSGRAVRYRYIMGAE